MRSAASALILAVLLHAWLGEAGSGEMPVDKYLLSLLTPVPRSKNRKWVGLQERYKSEIDNYKVKGLDLIVYGDSLIETLEGTSFGKDRAKFWENTLAWKQAVASKYRAAAHAIAGDTSMYLLWRIQNGGGPEGTGVKVVVVLIGSNDIARMYYEFKDAPDVAVRGVFMGVRLVVNELVAQVPDAKVVLLSILPLQPRGTQTYQWYVDAVNAQLRRYASEQSEQVLFQECGEQFITRGSRLVNKTLIPDGIHPTGRGGWLLAQCVRDAADEALRKEQLEQFGEPGKINPP